MTLSLSKPEAFSELGAGRAFRCTPRMAAVLAAALVVPMAAHPQTGGAVAAQLSPPAAPAQLTGQPPAPMAEQSPAPATVEFSAGQLTIEAKNSSLRSILDQLQEAGTKVSGLGADARVWGTYGPGNPQEVLASLLDDCGYNVLIAGSEADGAPREVDLSVKSAAPVQSAAAPVTQAAEQDEESDYSPPPTQPVMMSSPPPNSGRGPAGQQMIRTPQQMLEELERMRQATQNQPQQ